MWRMKGPKKAEQGSCTGYATSESPGKAQPFSHMKHFPILALKCLLARDNFLRGRTDSAWFAGILSDPASSVCPSPPMGENRVSD